MSTYLTRPVFTFRVNWDTQPEPTFRYDLRDIANEWGPLRFAPLQRQVVQGWKFRIHLNTLAEILAFETFADTCRGRLNGFWFPTPALKLQVVSGAGTELVIRDIGLRHTWDVGVPLHLWLSRPGLNPIAVAVDDVEAGDPGQEVVTLASALPGAIDATWRAQRLVYARFASDEEKAEWLEEGRQFREISVVELPQEYTAAETGLTKVWLYQFSYTPPGGTVDPDESWHYTSFQVPITSTYNGTMTGQVHASRPMTHGAIRLSIERPSIETQLRDLVYDSEGPWGRSRREGFPTLWVRIYEAPYATPNAARLHFTGEVKSWKSKGAKLTAPCAGGIDAGSIRLPFSKRGTTCQLCVFDGLTCKKSDVGHKVTAVVSAVDGLEVTLAAVGFAGKAANWYARGKVQTGTGRNLRFATALRSTEEAAGEITVLLSHSMGLATADVVEIWPGCDGLKETCQDKFDNYANFDGHPLVPVKNTSTDALSLSNDGVNKK